MQSHTNQDTVAVAPSIQDDNSAILQKAVWLLVAIALNAIELAIPRIPFFPWLKPGFANIITVLWIIKFGFKDAMLFTALRIWISGFYFGFSLFTFCLSISGGLLSTAAMSILWIALGKRGAVGIVGIAIIGAAFHNAGQLAVVYFMMARNFSLLGQIPFMLGASVVFGSIVGVIIPAAAKILDNANATSADTNYRVNADTRKSAVFFDKFITALTFTISISLMFVNNVYVLIAAALIFSLTAVTINNRNPYVFFYPIKFYMLFIFVAITYLFFSYGTRIDIIPFITKEGLFAFINQSLRLWCWLQTIHIFRKFNFNEIFISLLYNFFPFQRDTLAAGMTALKHFPEIMRFARSKKKIPAAALLFKPMSILSEYIQSIRNKIAALI